MLGIDPATEDLVLYDDLPEWTKADFCRTLQLQSRKALKAKVPTGEDAEWVLLGTGKGQAGPVTNMEQVLGKKLAEGERAKAPKAADARLELLGSGKAGPGLDRKSVV